MIDRFALVKIKQLSKQFPVVCILGPRQCGKTTLAKSYQALQKADSFYLDLESPSDIRKLTDPELLFSDNPKSIFILDEVQRRPDLFQLLRSVVDRNKRNGRFILLGSASPHLIKGVSETLAGRIVYIQTYPLHYTEVMDRPDAFRKHFFRGGFPDAFLAKKDTAFYDWMDAFARTFIERDLNTLFGTNFSPQLMFKLWRMLAHHHGGIWNAHSFAKGLDISPTTVNKYVEHLEGSFMLRKLSPYYTNIGKRLVKSPKIYIADNGLLHYLLDIHSYKTLQTHPVIGYAWEGYVIEQICQLLPRTIHPYFYRTHDGSEIDLVLVKGITVLCCIEIKWSNSPSISRGMSESISDLKSKNNYIIIPGDEKAITVRKGLQTVGFRHFISVIMKEYPK